MIPRLTHDRCRCVLVRRHPIHEARRSTAAARRLSLLVLLAVAAAPVLGSAVALLTLVVRP